MTVHRRKRNLSAYQKQIRFLTVMAVVFVSMIAGVLFWFLSRPTFPTH